MLRCSLISSALWRTSGAGKDYACRALICIQTDKYGVEGHVAGKENVLCGRQTCGPARHISRQPQRAPGLGRQPCALALARECRAPATAHPAGPSRHGALTQVFCLHDAAAHVLSAETVHCLKRIMLRGGVHTQGCKGSRSPPELQISRSQPGLTGRKIVSDTHRWTVCPPLHSQ